MKAAYIESRARRKTSFMAICPSRSRPRIQVLVKVKAVAVNPVDTYIRAGMYPMDLPKPFVSAAIWPAWSRRSGPAVTKYRKGDRVWGSNQGLLGRQGTFAEYAAVDECWLYPTPEEVSDQDAAAVALVGITGPSGPVPRRAVEGGRERVRQRRHGRGRLVRDPDGPGRRRRRVCHGRQRREGAICRQLGANMAVNYKTDDLDAALGKFGAIDVWFETLREQDFDRAVKHLAFRGRIDRDGGARIAAAVSRRAVLREGLQAVRLRHVQCPAEEQRKCAAEINRWLAKGKLRPRIGRVMRLSEAAAAHRLQEEKRLRKAGTLAGKIVLVP